MSTSANQAMPQFYTNVVPVSLERHSKYSLDRSDNCAFAKDSKSVFLACSEFQKARQEYPIVFLGTERQVMPAALLSLRDGENHFIQDDGRWDARYIPAYVRRYPFIAANLEETGNMVLGVDEGCEGLNQDGKGERFYSDDGERTEYLNRVSAFMTNFHFEFTNTQQFCTRLVELGLLEPMAARVQVQGANSLTLKGFYAVSYEKLKGLPENKLGELMANDELAFIFSHLHSLDRFVGLVERARKR